MKLWSAWDRRGEARVAPPREGPPDWRQMFKRRIRVVAVMLALWVVGVEARLAYLQIVKRPELVARAEKQHLRTRDVPAKRGDIVDRKGRVLATSVDTDTIYAVPSEIENADQAVAAVCGALGDCGDKERQVLVDRLRRGAFAYVRRQTSPEEKRRVEELNLAGIGFMKESRRFYPNRELGAHVLGYVGIDNNGLGGLEAAYDSRIRGKNGRVLVQTDARRHAFSRFERPPTSGSSIELTIDEYLQHIVERELHAGVVENRAAGGSAIMLDPRTGEILAMANEPTFNPNVYRDFDEVDRRNRAVQDLYEPGSTFKVVTASAALEEKVLDVDAVIDTNPGRLYVSGRSRVITDDSGRNNGAMTFRNVIVKSSNIGAVKIGFQVGTERLSRFVSLYGFGRTASPDFPGENSGIVWSADKWTQSALASVSMGYQVAVTPLQMAAAVSAVANEGQYMEPRVVRAVYRDGRRFAVQPKVLRRAISTDTAATLTGIMEGVVTDGTAKRARIDGYTIAGKTGTAQKLINGQYSHSDHFASFIGFAPSKNPAFAMVVVIDSAHGPNGDHGGTVAAPIFKRIAEAAMQYLGVPRNVDPEAPVLVARQDSGLPTALPMASMPAVSLVADGPAGSMPDLRGMSARDAMLRLAKLGLPARMTGDGFVVAQDPPAGTPLDAADVCVLMLERSPARLLATLSP